MNNRIWKINVKIKIRLIIVIITNFIKRIIFIRLDIKYKFNSNLRGKKIW